MAKLSAVTSFEKLTCLSVDAGHLCWLAVLTTLSGYLGLVEPELPYSAVG